MTSNLGHVQYHLGKYAQAEALHRELLATRRRLSDPYTIMKSTVELGFVYAAQGKYSQAENMLT